MTTETRLANPLAAADFPRRPLILTGYLWGGGAEWHLLNLAWTMRRLSIPVDVAYILDGARDAEIPWRRHGIEPIRLRSSAGIASLLRQGYDLVHAHLFKGELAGALAATALHVPLVISRHSLDWLNLPIWERATLATVVQRRARGIIAISEAVASVCRTALAGRPVPVRVIPYGIAPEVLRSKLRGTNVRAELHLEGCPLIGTAARLSPDKGLVHLLQAFRDTGSILADWHLVIAGDGPQRELLARQATDLGIAGRVHMLGWREDILDVVNSFDIFAFPSIREGFGLALLEAMISGIPAVVSDLPSIREVAGDATLYAPPADAAALAAALCRLATHPALRADLAGRGRQQAQRFSAETMTRQTLDFYRQVASSG